jgi:GTP pyrophosphokinase
MLTEDQLVKAVTAYDKNADEEALRRAYEYASKMHEKQKRESGEPYIIHPINVAEILIEYHLDYTSIIAALLHDVVEDTTATLEDVRNLFGNEVAKLVDGVTKLTRIEWNSVKIKQAENFRKLVLAMSEDIRVLMIKLADRLHNMRTLNCVATEEKKQRVARETMEIYVQLAERLGLHALKTEMEDIAFKTLHPEVYESLSVRLDFLREHAGTLIPDIVADLQKDMKENGIEAEVTGREKTPYSIWRKMNRQNITFEELCDIVAFRIIVNDVGECYQALGIINTKYPMIPGRYKDYISTPKPNGYKSIHNSVIGPKNRRIEIQIRTKEMHEVAENGVAAHWSYKQNNYTGGKQFRWLRGLLDIMEQASSPEEFLDNTKMEMYQDQVFCFTPKGDLIPLPTEATAIDFAYAIHSGVGNRCIGAKINGRIKPLRTVLANGDQVEIITSKVQNPSPEWERFAVTGKARAAIRRFIRNQKRIQYLELGRQLMQKAVKSHGQEYVEKDFEPLLGKYKLDMVEDLISAVGEGIYTPNDLIMQVYPEFKSTVSTIIDTIKKRSKRIKKIKTEGTKSIIKGLFPDMAMSFAKCCHPLPGDRIVGIITTGKGVTIHKLSCNTLDKFASEPERWIDVDWNENIPSKNQNGEDKFYVARIAVVLVDKPGALGLLSTAVAKAKSNITSLNMVSRTFGFTEFQLDIDVKNSEHLESVIDALRNTSIVNSVKRA